MSSWAKLGKAKQAIYKSRKHWWADDIPLMVYFSISVYFTVHSAYTIQFSSAESVCI